VTRRLRFGLFALFFVAGCLENLHQEKWFAKLEAADPALFERVTDCRSEIERGLDDAIANRLTREVERIGHFGESWLDVNTVIEDGVLLMRGRIRFVEGRDTSYSAAFRVNEGCALEIVRLKVYE
jgi:hypothetical protein